MLDLSAARLPLRDLRRERAEGLAMLEGTPMLNPARHKAVHRPTHVDVSSVVTLLAPLEVRCGDVLPME